MKAYRIELLGPRGRIVGARRIMCRDEDQAIDRTGELPHPGAMVLSRQGRRIAYFRPWATAGST